MLGGSGYIEESIMPRLYREAPVNSIWEGSGNIMCLDVLRAIERHAERWSTCCAANSATERTRGSRPLQTQLDRRLRGRAIAMTSRRRALLVRELVLALQGCAADRGTRRQPWRMRFVHLGSTERAARPSGLLPRGLDFARDRRPRGPGELELSEHRQDQAACARNPTEKAERAQNGHAHRVDDGVRQP